MVAGADYGCGAICGRSGRGSLSREKRHALDQTAADCSFFDHVSQAFVFAVFLKAKNLVLRLMVIKVSEL